MSAQQSGTTESCPSAPQELPSTSDGDSPLPSAAASQTLNPKSLPGPSSLATAAIAASHDSEGNHGHQSFWVWVLCLTGVDYFSTLGYQPSMAFEAAGRLAPLATVLLVLVTLFGALPVYCYVAGQSFHGQGSIAMLEKLVHGWTGKFLVLASLGFAATDYVITKTLSAADAAEHLIHNPFWHDMPDWLQGQTLLTMFLLVLLGGVFLKGFSEVIGLAVGAVAVYLALNVVVIGSGLSSFAEHPAAISDWWQKVQAGEWLLPHRRFKGLASERSRWFVCCSSRSSRWG